MNKGDSVDWLRYGRLSTEFPLHELEVQAVYTIKPVEDEASAQRKMQIERLQKELDELKKLEGLL